MLSATIIAVMVTGCGGGGGGGGNAAPVIGTSSYSTNEDTDLNGQLTATDADGDAVTFAKATDPGKGTLTSFTNAGAFVYRPNGNYSGSDSFTVRLTDARGSAVTSTISISIAAVNDAPAAVNDVLRADGAALANINVKSNDADSEGDAITVAIVEQSSVGTAAVNTDGTVRLTLPAGFKGVTRFKYSAADPTSASNTATAAVFVGTDPFRVVFAGDESANGQPELFMTDFVNTFRISAATEGNLRLHAFATAENGSTIAYTRQDSATGALDLSFNRNADVGSQTRVALPSSYALQDGGDQFVVSRDGKWIAFLAKAGSKISPFVFNVDTPGTIRTVEASTTALYAEQLKFSSDSTYLYFLGSTTNANQKALYRVQLAGNGVGAALSIGGSAGNDITEYQVSQDQTRVAFTATRGGPAAVYAVDPTAPAAETLVSAGIVTSTTLSKPLGLGSPSDGLKVAYTVVPGFTYVASLNGGGGPQLIQPYPVAALSPGGDYLLYKRPAAALPFQSQIWESVLVGGQPESTLGDGVDGAYDSEQNTVILASPSGSNTVLSATYRGSFGTTAQLGTNGQVARFYGLSGAPRGVALIGEGAPSGTVNTVHLALINARAPGTSLFLGSFNSPLAFGSSLATVVTY